MKNNSSLFKAGMFILAVIGFNFAANATNYVANVSGNYSSNSTWLGGTAPGFNITAADNILISTGVTVSLDGDLTIDNATADLLVTGTLSGAHDLNVQAGSLSGTGTLLLRNLTLAAGSTFSFTSSLTVDNLFNSQAALSLSGKTLINDTLGLYAGNIAIVAGDTLTFGTGAVVHIDGGTYTAGGGAVSPMGNLNLLYTGTGVITAGGETLLPNLYNVDVMLSSSSNQLNLSNNLTVTGQLNVISGSLNINGHSLVLNGTVNTSNVGSLSGTNLSNLTLGGGAGNMGNLIFTSGSNMLNNLTVNTAASGYTNLGSDLTVSGVLTLTSGGINLTGNSNLTLTGTDSIHGGSPSSYVATSGTGSLVATIASLLTNSRMMHIGTASAYAPIRITNNSLASGNFSASTHSGIFANGTAGSDLSATASSVNTSWDISSDLTTGINVALEAYWNTAMEVNAFDRSNVRLSHYINGAWDDSATVQASIHAAGMASVRRSGITSLSPFAVFSGPALGVNDISTSATFATYPNPAINTLTVSITDPKATDEVKVYDVIGNHIATYPMHNSNTIDITNLTSGVYFLSVNNTRTQKFVKQ
ncbi:MAG: hypothetical protein JWO03_3083 [Bacteroidetes bacterium]|nr:hypothetical protein [Bacteroidota bacterium]